jgi:hypothetical protein
MNEFSKTAQWEFNSGTKGANLEDKFIIIIIIIKIFPKKYNFYIMLTVLGIYELQCKDPVFCA